MGGVKNHPKPLGPGLEGFLDVLHLFYGTDHPFITGFAPVDP
jgi:hypothetical protein